MAEQFQASAPIIPVIDERIDCPTTAPKDHKNKVQRYNDLLEDIFQRELELSSIKSTLLDMRHEILEEARILETTEPSGLIAAYAQQVQAAASHDAAKSDASSAASSSSDSSDVDPAEHTGATAADVLGGRNGGAKVKVAKKTKTRAKGARRSKVPDAQLGGDWDYKLDISTNKVQRAGSDESESEDE